MPSSLATGQQQLTVTVGNLTSAPYTIAVNAVEPGLDSPPSFNIGKIQYALALFADGTYVLPVGAVAGFNSRPAKAGDEIVVYGVGFGQVSPSNLQANLCSRLTVWRLAFSMSIGGVPVATVPYAGLAPNFTGLYQFNVVVPANSGGGAVPLTFTVGGTAETQSLYLALSN